MLLLILFLVTVNAELYVSLSPHLISSIGSEVAGEISSRVAATHPPPYKKSTSKADVTFSSFKFDLELCCLEAADGRLSFLYFGSADTFNYHVRQRSFPHIKESGSILIYTPNQNHKALELPVSIDFSGLQPRATVGKAVIEVEQGDLIVYGHCSDRICVIPVSDIIDPLAKELLPSLSEAIQKEGQEAVNTVLSHLHDVVSFPFGLDFNLEGSVSETSEHGVLVRSGAVFMAGGAEPPFNPRPIAPPPISNAHDVEMFLSPFVLRSLVWAAAKENLFDLIITNAETKGLPFHLEASNTFFLGAVPSLANYSGLNITIATSMPSSPTSEDVAISPSNGVTIGPLNLLLDFALVNGTHVAVADAWSLNLSLTLSLNLSASISGAELHVTPKIVGHNASVSVVSSKLGSISTKDFDTLLTFAFAFAKLPPLEFKVPSAFTLCDVSVSLITNYVRIALDGSYKLTEQSEESWKRPAASQAHSTSILLEVSAAAAGIQLCGNGTGASCDAGKTCCQSDAQMTKFGCCPSEHASCCPDMKHCCPSGNLCSSDSMHCEKL